MQYGFIDRCAAAEFRHAQDFVADLDVFDGFEAVLGRAVGIEACLGDKAAVLFHRVV